MSSGYLVDTCAAIWLTQRAEVAPEARLALKRAWRDQVSVCVSAVTAWEMAMLVSRGRMTETKEPLRWYRDFIRESRLEEQPVTAEIYVASCFLPQPVHNDPTDRIIIATAREHDLTIITRDRAILSYGALGHVKVLAC
ncbi:type II toxin-antitoxin system VapC family toxin [Rhizobium sp. RU36D]|uniref:type II toxin-antitoxin system VapC family toxin n=1 Tax=Rhizobium sp. RU36D TaxID=1907415 RepID=UPI0009FF24CE|nr:type II toxin-antitoxin system VapC family toxin [Rhizobium sp. RU36D]